jgi:hypothetical protein
MALLRVGSNRLRVKALEAGSAMVFEILEAVGQAPRLHVGISREERQEFGILSGLNGLLRH